MLVLLVPTMHFHLDRTSGFLQDRTGNFLPDRTGSFLPDRTGNFLLDRTGNADIFYVVEYSAFGSSSDPLTFSTFCGVTALY